MASANIQRNKYTTFRYKFNSDLMSALHSFSKEHQFDNRQTYNEEWYRWCDNNGNIINKETQRLEVLGYTGDIKDKMYKSARYYFSKKANRDSEPKQRRTYVAMDGDTLDAMDNHIMVHINNTQYSPSWGYDDFCKNNISLLRSEIERFNDDNELITSDIIMKIKKTYKNRYFQYVNQSIE